MRGEVLSGKEKREEKCGVLGRGALFSHLKGRALDMMWEERGGCRRFREGKKRKMSSLY